MDTKKIATDKKKCPPPPCLSLSQKKKKKSKIIRPLFDESALFKLS